MRRKAEGLKRGFHLRSQCHDVFSVDEAIERWCGRALENARPRHRRSGTSPARGPYGIDRRQQLREIHEVDPSISSDVPEGDRRSQILIAERRSAGKPRCWRGAHLIESICLPQTGSDGVAGGDWILEHGLEGLKSGATLLMASLD